MLRTDVAALDKELWENSGDDKRWEREKESEREQFRSISGS